MTNQLVKSVIVCVARRANAINMSSAGAGKTNGVLQRNKIECLRGCIDIDDAAGSGGMSLLAALSASRGIVRMVDIAVLDSVANRVAFKAYVVLTMIPRMISHAEQARVLAFRRFRCAPLREMPILPTFEAVHR